MFTYIFYWLIDLNNGIIYIIYKKLLIKIDLQYLNEYICVFFSPLSIILSYDELIKISNPLQRNSTILDIPSRIWVYPNSYKKRTKIHRVCLISYMYKKIHTEIFNENESPKKFR